MDNHYWKPILADNIENSLNELGLENNGKEEDNDNIVNSINKNEIKTENDNLNLNNNNSKYAESQFFDNVFWKPNGVLNDKDIKLLFEN